MLLYSYVSAVDCPDVWPGATSGCSVGALWATNAQGVVQTTVREAWSAGSQPVQDCGSGFLTVATSGRKIASIVFKWASLGPKRSTKSVSA